MKPFLFLMISFIFLITSCDDSTSSNQSNPPAEAMDLYSPDIAISPDHPDANAQIVYFTVEYATVYKDGLMQLFAGADLPWQNRGDHWEYSEMDGELTVTIKIYDTMSDYIIEWVVDGTEGDHTYSNALLFKVYQDKGGRSGGSLTYDIDQYPGFEMITYTWSLDASDIYQATLYTNDPGEGLIGQTDITVNADGSGNLNIFTRGTLSETAIWATDGSGSITRYKTDPPTVSTWGPNPPSKSGDGFRPPDQFTINKIIDPFLHFRETAK